MLSILTTLALAVAPQAVDPIGSLQRLTVPTDPEGTVVISVELDGQPADLLLERYSLRAGDFQLLVSRPDGSVAPMPAPRPNTCDRRAPLLHAAIARRVPTHPAVRVRVMHAPRACCPR